MTLTTNTMSVMSHVFWRVGQVTLEISVRTSLRYANGFTIRKSIIPDYFAKKTPCPLDYLRYEAGLTVTSKVAFSAVAARLRNVGTESVMINYLWLLNTFNTTSFNMLTNA